MTSEEIESEEWRAVRGYEAYYEVSNFGRVRSIRAGGLVMYQCHCLLSTQSTVRFSVKGKQKTHRIHRLVADAFIENPSLKKEVNHKDGVRRNNHASNLEWVTRSENQLHATHVLKKGIGSLHGNSKLKEEDIINIFEKRKAGLTQREIAADFGVSHFCIGLILRRKLWRHIPI